MDSEREVYEELMDIGRLLSRAGVLAGVRRSASGSGVVVTDGLHHALGREYDVVVRGNCDLAVVARRIRADFPDMDVTRIAENALGLRTARRARHGD
jgi:hypothetical protein